jgi:1-phosphofructokinase
MVNQWRAAVLAPNLTLTVTLENGGPDGDDEVHIHPGGQGFWVARMLRHLGIDAVLCGPIGGETGAVIGALLESWQIELCAVEATADSPVIVQDRRSGEREEIAGTRARPLDRHTLDDAYTAFLDLALACGHAVITGQVTGVFPEEAYRRMAHDLASSRVRVVADVHGAELDSFFEGGPLDILKVSDEDLLDDGLLGDRSEGAALAAVQSLHDRGAAGVVLSRAEQPAIAYLGGQFLMATPVQVEPADFRGAGDSMTAALTAGLCRETGPIEMLRLACGAGAANATRHGLGSGSEDLIRRMAERVRVETLALPV